jgi:hypothetical protein
MDSPITLDLTLNVRGGRITGRAGQSNSSYVVDIRQDEDGFTIEAYNPVAGTREELDTGLTLDGAVAGALHAMGALAHNSFPGFEPVQED